ncbi:MAG: hypothetical protein A2622_11900 [Bdellovibrionales bacterium RIFCSPHIGHO2_01_FULL_40_29]|nr:MAG: hypothetical protein A2622_11900 [Bdellovibrionales bacterium RIFCSPHIGHO2_01_FULL_40_29]OFZ35631.1 MAG: hypothetical protein A3D17_00640 [Bdellovibrionales bacterium RIFCSPHIGHO2_02_FULL_40_15]
MKIAFLGYDLSATQTAEKLTDAGHNVAFFLKKSQQQIQFEPFHSIPVFCDRLMIPGENHLRTETHQDLLRKIKVSYSEIQNRLSYKSGHGTASIRKCEANAFVQSLDSIKDIQFDSKVKKHLIEIDKQGIESFDYVLTESHFLLKQDLDLKKINIFKKTKNSSYIWCSLRFEYEFLKPLRSLQSMKSFWIVLDSDRETLIDNWFYCRLTEKQIEFWTYQPESQSHNPEFQNFYIERIRQALAEKLPFLHLNQFLDSDVCTISYEGWNRNQTSTLILGNCSCVPHMGFWAQEEVDHYFENHIFKTFRKLKSNPEATL